MSKHQFDDIGFSTWTLDTESLLSPCKLYFKIEVDKDGSGPNILRSLTNFIFDEIFPQMSFSEATILINKCLELLPPGRSSQVNKYMGLCSSEHIISAFVSTETRYPGICIKAVEFLANCDNSGISTKILRFLKEHFSEDIFVTKILLPSGSVNSLCVSNYKKVDCSTDSPTTCRSYYKKFFWIWSIILATLLVFGICLGVYMFIQIRSIESNIPTMSIPPNFDHAERPFPVNQLPKISFQRELNVTSLSELRSSMKNIHHGDKIILNLSLNAAETWEEVVIENAYTVVKITIEGLMAPNVILRILQNMNNVQHVTLVNRNNLLCQDNLNFRDGLEPSENIELPNVIGLKLEGFSECLHVYTAISKNIGFPYLKHFHLLNGQITQSNMGLIQNLIVGARYYLSSINLESNRIYLPVIKRNLGTLPVVKYLRIDFPENGYILNENIGNTFSNTFPKLETFESRSGYLSWNEVLNLSYCKCLQNMTTGIKIEAGVNHINFIEMHDKFRKLKDLEVIFEFQGIELQKGCSYEGEKEVKPYYRKFKVDSNCPRIKQSY